MKEKISDKDEMINEVVEKDELIEEYEKKQKRDRRDKIILIIIIIILLLLFGFVGCRIGKIGYQQVSSVPNDGMEIIEVTQEDIRVTKDTELDIFKNEKFNGEKKIAPRSKGTYKFCIENVADENITYDIKFTDEMKYLVNMKYKLKIDNVYIRGNEEEYIDIDSLNVEDVIVLKDSINIFTLEWYWADDDINDTIVGSHKTDEYYKLDLKIEADRYQR